jgi:hypothetical protein
MDRPSAIDRGRWIGRSEDDVKAEAAQPLILSASGAACLTSRSERAIHQLMPDFVQHFCIEFSVVN